MGPDANGAGSASGGSFPPVLTCGDASEGPEPARASLKSRIARVAYAGRRRADDWFAARRIALISDRRPPRPPSSTASSSPSSVSSTSRRAAWSASSCSRPAPPAVAASIAARTSASRSSSAASKSFRRDRSPPSCRSTTSWICRRRASICWASDSSVRAARSARRSSLWLTCPSMRTSWSVACASVAEAASTLTRSSVTLPLSCRWRSSTSSST